MKIGQSFLNETRRFADNRVRVEKGEEGELVKDKKDVVERGNVVPPGSFL